MSLQGVTVQEAECCNRQVSLQGVTADEQREAQRREGRIEALDNHQRHQTGNGTQRHDSDGRNIEGIA